MECPGNAICDKDEERRSFPFNEIVGFNAQDGGHLLKIFATHEKFIPKELPSMINVLNISYFLWFLEFPQKIFPDLKIVSLRQDGTERVSRIY